jgi:hypothetical protein
VPNTIDPVAGSYFVESLTNEIEARAVEYIDKIDGMGGAVAAIEAGFYQDEIADAAFRIQQGIESGERVVVGVNRFEDTEERPVEIQRISEEEVRRQVERTQALRAGRDDTAVREALAAVSRTAEGTDNLLPPMKEALRARATLGEVSDTLREAFGEYRPRAPSPARTRTSELAAQRDRGDRVDDGGEPGDQEHEGHEPHPVPERAGRRRQAPEADRELDGGDPDRRRDEHGGGD